MKAQDRMMAKMFRLYGFWAALRFARNAGVAFEDTYFMVFGKLPTR
jgi:hypothetical protein